MQGKGTIWQSVEVGSEQKRRNYRELTLIRRQKLTRVASQTVCQGQVQAP